MLSSSFQHLDGISERRERELWRNGIVSWDDLDAKLTTQLTLFRNHAQHVYSRMLAESRAAIGRGDAAFFARRLPKREHYKIALAFPKRTLFLDIETTGLSRYYDQITIVGWSLGSLYGAYIKGTDQKALRKALAQAKVIVTFNGSLFDLPFLRHEFPDLPLPDAHVDLRFLARRAGLPGPQKKVERQLGFARDDDLAEVDGKVAPVLWHRYRRGERDALMRLIRYNHADIEGMKQIFDAAIERLAQRGDVPAGMHASTRFSDSKSVITRDTRRGRQAGIVIRVPRFKGRSGPATTFRELAKTAPIEQLRVVGIDLTGSERRASGWCLTVGPHATTALVHSDEELIQRTLESHPDLVSIDSPLSLPTGRTSVSDDDPGRASAGIMRRCERILRQRGVSVYPCLIPSMQRLTERGMQLATTLRSRGVPVIESYPGAAQDILSIPRKRASLELLSSGLSDFGLVGPWTNETATHDELDAITSSLVGLFFWAGRFEALGNEEEGYLIVPALKPDEQVWAERTVIGISGPIAAGKTTAAKVLEQRGFHYARFSEVLAEILRDRDVAITRESLQQVGDEVHRNPGQRWLCERLVSCLPMRGDIVIDGLRHPEDHSYLVERYGPTFRHVHIEAPLEWRRTRYTSLGHAPEEFDRAMSHPVEANVDTLEKLAHERIANVGSVAELGTKIGAATGLQVRKS